MGRANIKHLRLVLHGGGGGGTGVLPGQVSSGSDQLVLQLPLRSSPHPLCFCPSSPPYYADMLPDVGQRLLRRRRPVLRLTPHPHA